MSDDDYFSMQIEQGNITPTVNTKGIAIELAETNDSVITGKIANGSKDTLTLRLNSRFFNSFETQVKLNNEWYAFQTFRPYGCGMGIGIGKLFPNYECKIELENPTRGKVNLPFRLKIMINNQEFYSNEIMITCSDEQYKMIKNPIKRFTW